MSKNILAEIEVPYPENDALNLEIAIGASRFNFTPLAESEFWVTGDYESPENTALPTIKQTGGSVKITQQFDIPSMAERILGSFPTLRLGFNKARPFALKLSGGAAEGQCNLGGIPLTNLEIKKGAGKFEFDFSEPNPQRMKLLNLDCGAAGITLRNLANANFEAFKVDGGAATYTLDFGGTLQADSHSVINVGMATVEILIPSETAAKVNVQTTLGSLDLGDGFMKKEDAFWTEAAVAAAEAQGTPILTIDVTLALGSLTLKTT